MNPANAVLNYLYAILEAEARRVEGTGTVQRVVTDDEIVAGERGHGGSFQLMRGRTLAANSSRLSHASSGDRPAINGCRMSLAAGSSRSA